MSDILSIPSRDFFERTRLKLMTSLLLASSSLMLLGFCSSAGGVASYNNNLLASFPSNTDDHVLNSHAAKAGGYGFATFCYLIAFFLLLISAVYVSPLLCGSAKEKKMLSAPEELDGAGPTFSDPARATGHVV